MNGLAQIIRYATAGFMKVSGKAARAIPKAAKAGTSLTDDAVKATAKTGANLADDVAGAAAKTTAQTAEKVAEVGAKTGGKTSLIEKFSKIGSGQVTTRKSIAMGLGTAVAAKAAVPLAAAADNATGNHISKAIASTDTAGFLIEKALALKGWADEENSSVVESIAEREIAKRVEGFNPDAPDYEGSRSQVLIKAASLAAVGGGLDAILKLGKLNNVDIDQNDLVESIRKAQQAENVSMGDRCAIFYEDLNSKIDQREIAEKAKQQQTADATTQLAESTPTGTEANKKPSHLAASLAAASGAIAAGKDHFGDVKDAVADKVEQASESVGLFASITNFFNNLADSIGNAVKDTLISVAQSIFHFDEIKDSSDRGNVVSKTGMFPGIGQDNGHDYGFDHS